MMYSLQKLSNWVSSSQLYTVRAGVFLQRELPCSGGAVNPGDFELHVLITPAGPKPGGGLNDKLGVCIFLDVIHGTPPYNGMNRTIRTELHCYENPSYLRLRFCLS
jgi:hypothetical protein